MDRFMRIFDQGHLALGAYSTSQFLSQVFNGNQAIIPANKDPDWLPSVPGSKFMTQKNKIVGQFLK